MSGRLHHPLDQIAEHDSDDSASGPMTQETSAETGAEDSTGASPPWTAGLSVESAADIAAKDDEDTRFSRPAAEQWAPGADAAVETEPAPAPDWATSQFVRDNEVAPEAEPQESGVAEPVGEDHHDAAEPADRVADSALSPGGPVSLAVWMDRDLRRRIRAAHTYTGDDEGFETLSDYVAGVLERDVQRIERTYNQGVAFPGEEDEQPPAAGDAYEVRARFGEGLWELRIEDAGVTLSPTLAGAETMARTYVCVLKGIPADSVSVTVVPELEGDLSKEIARTRHDAARAEGAVSRAEEMLAAARAELGRAREDRHRVTARLRDHGLSEADVDTVLAITPEA